MPIAMLFERLVASKGASSCAAESSLLIEQQNGANRSICCSNRRNWELVRSLHRPAALRLPSYRPCRQPNSTRVDLERGLLSLCWRHLVRLLLATRRAPSPSRRCCWIHFSGLPALGSWSRHFARSVFALLSFFLLFFSFFLRPPGHLAAPPRPPSSPTPRAAGLRGHSFAAGRHMPASPAPQAPGPPGPL